MIDRSQASYLANNQIFAMKMGETARILVLDEKAHMVDVHFVGSRECGVGGRLQCLGIPEIVDTLGSDGQRCPACRFKFTREGNIVSWALRSYAIRIAQYETNNQDQILEPINLVPKIWRFWSPTFNMLADLAEEVGGLQGREILVKRLDPRWDVYDIDVAKEPILEEVDGLYDQYAHLLNLSMDLNGAIGVELSFDHMDRMLNPERWLHSSLSAEEMNRLMPLGDVLPDWVQEYIEPLADEDL